MACGLLSVIFARQHTGKRYAVYYGLWILTGTLCFAYADWSHTSGFILGYYSAINVGYSIGWSWPPQDDSSALLFSSAYLLFGAGMVSLALGAFADGAMKDRDKWFAKLMKQKEFEETTMKGGGSEVFKKLTLFLRHYKKTIIPITLWLTFLVAMMMNGRYGVGFSWYENQYFALTSCSTGGMVAIPEGSPRWTFLLHAFLTSLGVPAMAWAVGAIGKMSVQADKNEIEKTRETINEPVSAEELEFLTKLGLENGDGEIDRAEFIILCMVRMGIDVSLLQFISDRFKELDDDNNGTLTIREITNGRYFQDATGEICRIPSDRGIERSKTISKPLSGKEIRESVMPLSPSESKELQSKIAEDWEDNEDVDKKKKLNSKVSFADEEQAKPSTTDEEQPPQTTNKQDEEEAKPPPTKEGEEQPKTPATSDSSDDNV